MTHGAFTRCLLTRMVPQVVRDICALGRTSKLRGLKMRFISAVWKLNLPLQHKMIAQHLARACPAATRISFDDAIEWRKELAGAKWKPVIRSLDTIKALLTTQPDVRKVIQVTDFDGALAAALDGEVGLSV